VGARVFKLLDGGFERLVKAANLIVEDLREPDQKRRREPAFDEIVDDFFQIDSVVGLGRFDDQVAFSVDVEVTSAPACDPVRFGRLLNGRSHVRSRREGRMMPHRWGFRSRNKR
jgi:hypothetical protein